MKILQGILKSNSVEKLLTTYDEIAARNDSNERAISNEMRRVLSLRGEASRNYARDPKPETLRALVKAAAEAVAITDHDLGTEVRQALEIATGERWQKLAPLIEPAVAEALREIDVKLEQVRASARTRADEIGIPYSEADHDPAVARLEQRRERVEAVLSVHVANGKMQQAANALRAALS